MLTNLSQRDKPHWQGIVTRDERARAIDLARQLKLTVGEIARMGKFVRLSHV